MRPPLARLAPLAPLVPLALAACVARPPPPATPPAAPPAAASAGAASPAAPRASGKGWAVATESMPATQAAAAALERGGSAADAAIVAALTAGVVTPVSSGIGGGGFAVVYDARTSQVTVLDFRETSPAAYDAAAAEASGARAGMAVGVPGEVAGLAELHRRWGKRPWAEDVEAAAALADKGFAVPAHTARVVGRMSKAVAAIPALAAIFLPGGNPLPQGAEARNPALAATLRTIARKGPAGFYEGPVASSYVAAARAAGSALTEHDLASYRVQERAPLRASWGRFEVFSMPPPSAGGFTLLTTLGMFPPADIGKIDPTTADGVHTLAEVFRGVMADRMKVIGDPGSDRGDLGSWLSPERLRKRRAAIAADRTRPVGAFVGEDHGTSHLIVVDQERNVVSLTTTVNSPFGARLVADDIGVVLNDELRDFPRRADLARLGVGEAPGMGRPGVRPPSSMTPAVVLENGRPRLALGGSGGMRIATSVTQVALGMLGSGLDPATAIARPRVHVPPDGALLLEPGALSAEAMADLTRRGERVREEEAINAVQVILLGTEGLEAAADPRKFGLAQARLGAGA